MALILEPLGNGSRRFATKLLLIFVIIFCVGNRSLSLVGLLSLQVINSFLLALSDRQAPILDNPRSRATRSVILRPGMNTANLILYKIALQLRIFLGVAITRTLIMLATVVDPNVLRDESSTHLITAKDMGDGFSHLGASIAVGNVHAHNGLGSDHWRKGRRSVRGSIGWRAGWRGMVGVLR